MSVRTASNSTDFVSNLFTYSLNVISAIYDLSNSLRVFALYFCNRTKSYPKTKRGELLSIVEHLNFIVPNISTCLL